jgi:two-component system sensor histidine kinase UhpB
MNSERSYLLQVLRNHRDTIAQSWYCAIAHTSFVPLSSADIRAHLLALTDQLIAALFAEPFVPADAQAIGAALARLHYMKPESLGQTLDTLAHEIGAALTIAHHGELHARLAELLSALSSGFYGQATTTILAQQEQLRAALFTEQARVAAALHESDERFRAIFQDAAVGITLTDSTGRIIESNPAVHGLLGYSEEELRHLMFTQFTHPDDVTADMEMYQILVVGHCDSYRMEKRYIRKDGRVIWGYVNVSLIRNASGAPQFALGMIEDITERKRVEAELAGAQRRLAERLEAERLHLARELHDSAVQQLLGISYQLIERHRAVGEGRGAAADVRAPTNEDIRREVLGVVSQLRSLIGELRPAGLQELGLTIALEGYVARLQREGGPLMPQIALELDQSGTALPQSIALCIFRSAQEALRNALKHAQAQQITLRLSLWTNEVVLHVQDDGCGFRVPARLSELALADHFGLVGIAERVASAGGHCTIQSRPAQGTHVIVRIPLSEARSNDDQANPSATGR